MTKTQPLQQKFEQKNIKNYIYYCTILFAFFLPLSRAAISFFIIALPLLWLVEGQFQRKYEQIKENKLLLALLLFALFSQLSILWSNNYDLALKHLRLESYFFVIFVIATSIKEKQIQTIITAFLLGMLISEIIAYGVFFELWSFKHASVYNPSPFMMHIDYSVFMALSSVLLLNRIFSKRYGLKQKLFFTLFFFTVTGNLFLAIGRTGQLALIAAILVMTVLHFRFTIKSLFIAFILLATIFTAAYSLSDTFKIRSSAALEDVQNISNMQLDNSWGIRIAYYITTYDIVKENLFFGVGLGDYLDETKKTLSQEKYYYLSDTTKEFMSSYHPHNQYLLVLMQMGVIGLFLFLNILYQLTKMTIKNLELKQFSLLFATVFFVSCIAEPLLSKQFTLSLFVLFTGLFSIKNDVSV